MNNSSIAYSDEIWNVQTGRDDARDFSSNTMYTQISNTQDQHQFNEGIPSSINTLSTPRYCSIENAVKLTGPLPYPFEYPKTVIADDLNSSFGTVNHGCDGLLVDTSTGSWGFNNFTTPPELEWTMTEQGGLSSNSLGLSRFSNNFSLGNTTSQRSTLHETSIPTQCSEMSSSGVTSYSLHKGRSEHGSCSGSNLSLSFNSDKPLQLSTLLSGSRFFQAMQEILAEIACYALENFDQMSYSANGIDDNSFSPSCTAGKGGSAIDFSVGLSGNERIVSQNKFLQEQNVEAKKKHLLSLLQVVDDRYNQCLDEIHTVISAFHAVTEVDPNLHARFALPTISFMYKNLRERISSHILAIGARFSEEGEAREEKSVSEARFLQKQWALQQLRKRDHQLWKPQRGLPERSVSVLRAWMFQNFLHPYPRDAEKHLLALKSGLTRSQVSNWFINARVRLWKPMIEQMYAEMNRRKASRNDEGIDGTQRNHVSFGNRRIAMD